MPVDRDGLVYGALDIAKSTGVAIGNPFEAVECQTWNAKAETRADRFTELRAWLIPWLIRWRPLGVAIERPMDARAMARLGTPFATQMQLTGLVAVAEMTCAEYDVPTVMYERQEVLLHFTGVRRYKEKDDGKRACVVRCKQLKYEIEGYDQADAAALWDYACVKWLPKRYAMIGVDRALARRAENVVEAKPPKRNRPVRKRLSRGRTLFS